jgi:hypothetical protein
MNERTSLAASFITRWVVTVETGASVQTISNARAEDAARTADRMERGRGAWLDRREPP